MRKLFFYFIILSSLIYSQVVPIIDLRQNDASGIPVGNGQMFTVSGIVTCSNQFGNSGPGAVQDNTAGISVYGTGFVNQVQVGDSVTITAQLTHFNGLSQLDFTKPGALLVKHTSNHSSEPVIVTVAQILAQQWNGIEDLESELIRINNVTISGSGNFSGGTSGKNYNFTDPTGTLQIRIDESVNIVNTPIPGGSVDIIGILSQYKFAAPFNSGYQIIPRFIQDIVDDDRPMIINPVVASNIDTSSFTVYFSTIRSGNSQVKYGLTENLELDSVVINDDTTNHKVVIIGLVPSTKYYFKAVSTNGAGTSVSSLQYVTTASSNPALGKINVYFNFSVDTTVAILGNKANGNVDFKTKLIERINSAVSSIDLALYSFYGLNDIANAIVAAKNRGVKIRFVYENRNDQNNASTLFNAGVPYIKRHSSPSGLMHNKFFIFDARDNNPMNDWVWTGSWNISSSELSWKNNVVEINDPGLALAYTAEFEEMWGSNTDTPNPTNAKFGSQKSDNTQHNFTIGGKQVQLYFSPSDNTSSKIASAINTANDNVYFSQYAFTRVELREALYSRYQLGVTDLRGIVDQINTTGSQYTQLQSFAQMFENTTQGTLHHKYGMVDVTNPNSTPLVITGSHNWSSAAETNNDENTLIIYDIQVGNQYMQEFKARYNSEGGSKPFIVPVMSSQENNEQLPTSFSISQNYPNPFNPSTIINYSIPNGGYVEIRVFNMLGQEVKTLVSMEQIPGNYEVVFNASELSSGIYFYCIKSGDFFQTKKMMLLK